MNNKQKQQIAEVMQLRETALAGVYAASAKDMTALATRESRAFLQKGRFTIAEEQGITDKLIREYTANINRGGTMCVDRVLKPLGGGKYSATTERKFVPWLSDMTDRDTKDIIELIGKSEQNFKHPMQIARELKTYFEGTTHNAMTAARTEAAKIRSDARKESFLKAGIKHVRYVTAGDENVRPEHAMRDGKIYRIDEAPELGEINCRCVLVPADYEVEKGAKVEKSDEEIIDLDEKEVKPEPKTEKPIEKIEPKAGRDFSTAKTIDDIRELLAEKYPNMELPRTMKLDVESLAQGFQKVEALRQDFPAIGTVLTHMKVRASKSVYASIQPKKDDTLTLTTYSSYYGTGTRTGSLKSYAHDVEKEYHPKNTTFDDVLTHEMGHVLEYAMVRAAFPEGTTWIQKWNAGVISGEIIRKARDEIREELSIRYGPELAAGSISEYAKKNNLETFAEAIADVYANGENAALLSRKIVKYAKQKYKEVIR